jgi:exosortase
MFGLNSKYTNAIITCLLLGLIATIFQTTSFTYLNTWLKFDESMGHGLLIVGLSLFVLFTENKSAPLTHKYTFNIIALIAIPFIILIHQASEFLGILVFQQFSLYLLWLCAVIAVLGVSFFRANKFPLLFFLFAVPFWEFLNPIFLWLTTIVVTSLLDLTPIIAFIQGNRIELPYGILEIADGCSGLRYFQIGFALSVFAVYKENISLKLKFLVVFIGITLGIITNWIRVLSLIYVGYDSKMTSPLMTDHETHGLVLFAIVIAPLILFINWLAKHYSLNKNDQPQSENTPTLKDNKNSKHKFIYLLVSALLIVSVPMVLNVETAVSVNKVLENNNHQGVSLLKGYGNYKQIESLTPNPVNKTNECKLVTRTYSLSSSGKDVLPYGAIYSKNFYQTNKKTRANIKNNQFDITTNKLTLFNKQISKTVELYYWYQLYNYTTTNKHIAKLLEVLYLFNNDTPMMMKIIVC